jgi:hypothetical protein
VTADRLEAETIVVRQGFGGRVIDRMIGQTKGNVALDGQPQGLICEITLRA